MTVGEGTPVRDELLVTVVRIETKLDRLLTDHTDHETRLRALERWRWGVAGLAAGLGGAAGSVVNLL